MLMITRSMVDFHLDRRERGLPCPCNVRVGLATTVSVVRSLQSIISIKFS